MLGWVQLGISQPSITIIYYSLFNKKLFQKVSEQLMKMLNCNGRSIILGGKIRKSYWLKCVYDVACHLNHLLERRWRSTYVEIFITCRHFKFTYNLISHLSFLWTLFLITNFKSISVNDLSSKVNKKIYLKRTFLIRSWKNLQTFLVALKQKKFKFGAKWCSPSGEFFSREIQIFRDEDSK